MRRAHRHCHRHLPQFQLPHSVYYRHFDQRPPLSSPVASSSTSFFRAMPEYASYSSEAVLRLARQLPHRPQEQADSASKIRADRLA